MNGDQDYLTKCPEILQFLETHQGDRDAVQRAASVLHGEPDAEAALRKLLPAFRDRIVKVFLSYKKEDERAATVLDEVLRENSAEKLEITFQARFTEEIPGKQWRQQIRDRVRLANWFILLLPHPSDELDWCLFETGLFEAQLTAADRLICLHHPDSQIPSPIEGYHAVAATIPEMQKFLRMVYVEDNPVPGLPPLNRAIERRVPELAARIVEAIRAPKRRIYQDVFVPWINLRLEESGGLKSKEDLDSATVVSANNEALELFGFRQAKTTFGELRSAIVEEHGDSRWREELFHVIRKISQDRIFHPIQAVLHAPDGKMYRPVAYGVDRSGPEGPVQAYHVTFSEEVSATDIAVMPPELAKLVSLLRFTFRFRWEVLERFSKGPLSAGDVSRVEMSLARITMDWQSRGAIAENDIESLFSGEQAERVREMRTWWDRLRRPDGTGELDVAIAKKDGATTAALLADILPINQEFLEMVTDRFAAVIGRAKS